MKLIKHEILDILSCFALDSPVEAADSYGRGHINDTSVVVTLTGNRYILQRISTTVFHNVPGLMANVQNVTEYLKANGKSGMKVLSLIPTKDGASYVHLDSGYWRVYEFVENSLCLQEPADDEDFCESARGFGSFMNDLAGFPVERLCETIPNFHNTPDRYRIFRKTLENDPMDRAKDVQPEIEFFLAHEAEMGLLEAERQQGMLPLRVTHNDTKLNNLLLDKDTRKSLCVLDLDTVMPGLSLYDYGDAIRYGAATAAEDERSLEKVSMSLSRFEAFTRGWLEKCTSLTEEEIRLLPLGAKTMTVECGLRFLTDYIDGDRYFGCYREGQNLDRARTHIKLAMDMEEKWDQMHGIVERLKK